MLRPTTRLLTMLELFQARGRMTGPELAARLEVNIRTVRRYLAMLEELGVPLRTERGRDGGYELMAGFKLPPMMFTDDEALALSVGLLAARGLGLAEAAPAAASAQAKLERVMPPRLERRVRAVNETVQLELARAPVSTNQAVLATLSLASQRTLQVRLRYRGTEGPASERVFEPYRLAYRGGRWYAVGHCQLRGGLRSFRLDRIETVEPLELHFARPAGFDALQHLTLAVATLPRAFEAQILLHTSLEAARRAVFPALGVLEEQGAQVLLRAQVDDLQWLALELARLPFGFQVVQPRALNEALRTLGNRLLERAGPSST